MPNFYLTNRAEPTAPIFELLPSCYVDRDTPATDELTREGWRYAESVNTGYRYLVRWKQNRRWLKAWGKYVTDFEVRTVETVADSDGVIWAALGGTAPIRLYGPHEPIAEELS